MRGITNAKKLSEKDKAGIIWTSRASATEANAWASICYGNGLFVAISSNGTSRVMTSPDGITWTARTSATEANTWNSVCYGNGLFVAVASYNTNRVMTSPDGITWTPRTSAVEANSWQSVCYGNGLFVAVSTDGTSRVMTSPDGIAWTPRASSAETNSWRPIAYGNGLFVVMSDDGTNRIMTSSDGITWISRIASTNNTWRSVCYGNGLFVAIAYSGTNRVMTSGISGQYNNLDYNPTLPALYNAKCAGDVTLTTASTFYTGATLTLPIGVYFIKGTITVARTTTTAQHYQARIQVGGVTIAEGQNYVPSVSNGITSLSMSNIVRITTAATVVNLQATSYTSSGSNLIKAALIANGAGNNATQLTAWRIE